MEKNKKMNYRLFFFILSILTALMLAAMTSCDSKATISPTDMDEPVASIDPASYDVIREHAYQRKRPSFGDNFRSILLDDELIAYDAMVQHLVVERRTDEFHIDGFKKGYASSGMISEALTFAWDSVRLDYPEIFWPDYVSHGNIKTTWVTDFVIIEDIVINFPGENYPGAKNCVDTVFNGIDDAVNEIKNQRKSHSRYDTLKAIYHYICTNVQVDRRYAYLDMNAPDSEDPDAVNNAYVESSTLAPVFGGGSAGKIVICGGYSKAFKALCNRFDIPCVIIDGWTTRMGHEWNYVKMEDGKWYACDVTFDDDDPGPFSPPQYAFFLVGNNTRIYNTTYTKCRFPNKGALYEDCILYPEIADEKYTPAA